MFLTHFKTLFVVTVVSSALMACGGSQSSSSTNRPAETQTPTEQKSGIQPAQKLSPDATAHAQRAWDFLNQVEPLLKDKKIDQLDVNVRQPIRQLTEEWMTQVKMTDAVTEGKYAMCRKSLISMDAWARELLQNGSQIEKKQESYLRDKALCADAIQHPELGNTDPKKLVKS